nr:MAG TPA: viroplasmin [Caudoviricetes sp.]
MTTTLEMRKFFVYGIENGKGETFRMIKEAKIATSVASSAVEFYRGAGFEKVVATNCNDNIFVKDSTGRLLAFVTEVCHLKADGSKEYRTAYWAWKEVNRNAEAVVKKAAEAAAKVDTETTKQEGREVATEKIAIIKGSIEVKAPQEKMPWFYAVRNGRSVGIFTDWGKASESVTGYPDARFKKFRVLKDAQEFMKGGNDE